MTVAHVRQYGVPGQGQEDPTVLGVKDETLRCSPNSPSTAWLAQPKLGWAECTHRAKYYRGDM